MLKFFLYLFPLIYFVMHTVVGGPTIHDGPPPTWTTIAKPSPILSWEPVISQAEIECMAKNIYFEAAVESTAGQLAVAQVTLNRVKSSYYPNTVCEVVYEGKHYTTSKGEQFPVRDRCQFSWYCDGKGDEIKNKGKLWDSAHDLARYVLKRQNDLIDITDGATHYHATYIDAPRWAHQKRKHMTIDQHIFYGGRKGFNF